MRSLRKGAFLILCVVSYLLFRGIGDHGLLDPLEGLNASVALNMAAGGPGFKSAFTPAADILPWQGSKTTGFWWLAALALRLFGWTEFSVRFWSAAAAAGTGVIVWLTAKRTTDVRAANYAAVIAVTSLPFFAVSQLATAHSLYVFFITAALFGVVRAFRERRFFLLLHLASMLAFIVQGPAGALLPWLALLLYSWFAERERFFVDAFLYPPGLAATALLGGGYLLLLRLQNPALLMLMRFNPLAPALASLSWAALVVLAGLCPWGGFYAETLMRRFARGYSPIPISQRPDALFLIWSGVFLFFGFFSGDALLATAAFPALAPLCGEHFARAADAGKTGTFQRAVLYEILFMVPFLAFCLVRIRYHELGSVQKTFSSMISWSFFCVLFLFVCWHYARTRQPKKLMLHAGLTSLLCLLPLAGAFDVLAGETSVRNVGLFLRKELQKQDVLVQYAINRPSLYFYTAHPSGVVFASPIPGITGQQNEKALYLRRVWSEPERVFLLIEKHQQIQTPPLQEVYNLKEGEGLVVLSNRNSRQIPGAPSRLPPSSFSPVLAEPRRDAD